ncbi:MAG: DUF3820 family protein [Candidatus Omnitrophica bacterium]|jgi:uncharacterized protein (DUF3820 family)|nr:DUF3820 family protein [Candidatus Omnitrophota bacterium]
MSRSYEDKPMPFGEYKGELICDVPTSYLAWLLDQNWFNKKFADLKDIAEQEMEYRKRWNLP